VLECGLNDPHHKGDLSGARTQVSHVLIVRVHNYHVLCSLHSFAIEGFVVEIRDYLLDLLFLLLCHKDLILVLSVVFTVVQGIN
jgi:hypothetical protein